MTAVKGLPLIAKTIGILEDEDDYEHEDEILKLGI